MKLYGFPGGPWSRHHRCEWVLEEVGADYQFIPLDFMKREQRSEEMRKLNPAGRVPVLVDGDLVIWESSAICTYIADKFPDKNMVPKAGSAGRALYNQWMSFATCEMDAQLMIIGKNGAEHYFPEITPGVEVGEVARNTAVAAAKAEFDNFAKVVANHLEGREFLLESGFSAADVVMWWVLNSAQNQGLISDYPRLLSYVEDLQKRPKFPVFVMPTAP